MGLELDVAYSVDSVQDERWNDHDYNKTSNWNGRSVQQLDTDLSMQSIYHDAKFTNTRLNNMPRVYLIEDTHGNDSFNPPSQEANSDSRISENDDIRNRLYYEAEGRKKPDGSSEGRFGVGYGRESSNSDGTQSKTDVKTDLYIDDRGKVSGGIVFKHEVEF